MASPSPTSAAAQAPASADVAIGTVLDGRYRIDAVLGTGGMGRVYRGEHLGIGRPVAIKVLHADLNRNRDAAARFQREAIASGRLDHPNIVNVNDFGVLDDGAPYMVMEVLDGEALGDRLGREKHLPWREALEIMRGVLCGLSHAHERGVVHRDIKPDNVYLTHKDGDLTVKILDFGIAKLYAGDADDPASTRTGLTVGTPAYLSPEQAVGGAITPASDLYSATVMLFEMLAGRAPFEDADPLAMLGAHVSRPPPHVGDIAPGIELPYGLEEIIQTGLAKSAAERITSATDYIARVDAILTAPRGSVPVALARELLRGAPTATTEPAISPLANVSDQSILLAVDQLSTRPRPPRPFGAPPPRRASSPSIDDQSITISVDPPSRRGGGDAEGAPAERVTGEGAPEERARSAAQRTPEAQRARSAGSHQEGAPEQGPARSARIDPTPPASRPGTASSSSGPEAGGAAIPRRWIVGGGIVAGAIAVVAIVLAIPAPRTPATPGAAPVAAPPRPLAPAIDRDTELKALLHDLQNGKTCEERRATIPKLVAFRDPRVIEQLKKARYRMYGGVLGFGANNANSCLTKDASAALKVLGAVK